MLVKIQYNHYVYALTDLITILRPETLFLYCNKKLSQNSLTKKFERDERMTEQHGKVILSESHLKN